MKQYDAAVGLWARILVQVTIYRRLRIGRDGHLDQSEAYDIVSFNELFVAALILMEISIKLLSTN